MTQTMQVNFTYDPIVLTKLTLQIYAEKHFDTNDAIKSTVYAVYEYLRTVTDEELERVLILYTQEEKIEAITFSNFEEECKLIFTYIFKSQQFIDLEFGYKREGYSKTGLGVVDKYEKTFYECTFGEHWLTVESILETKYPKQFEAYLQLNYENKEEHNGFTHKQLDQFILNTFELVGEMRSIENHLD
ncbi:hypothetical protein M3Y14_34030 (plasmid) [Bacillus thuringiensis]|uniref:hypothetical protein n=1 Tax=Bacillus thuringiensis TaxID=1428 RepID=UPI0022255581|nr:hypothetical protein [Bacillus thuringiensis]UYX56268.1 hypothetical protein M3Y14_34030 [Bacillus thuringiensis]